MSATNGNGTRTRALRRTPSTSAATGPRPPLERDRARLRGRGRHPAARLAPDRALARPPRRREALAPARRGGLRRRARRAHRRPGRADGEGRTEGDLPLRLAGRGGRQPRRPTSTPTRASTPRTASRDGAPPEQRAAARRPDRVGGGQRTAIDYLLPIVADAEAGFGGPLNAFELMKGMIEAGAAAVHFEDQLASEKKCGHLGGKVLVPTGQFIRTLLAARLAADVMGVPTLARRPHRRRLGEAADERRRRARPRVPDRRAHTRGLLPRPRRRRGGDRPRPRVRAVRRSRLDGDVDARSR